MATETLEQRVLRLENTVQKVQEQLAQQQPPIKKRGWRWFVGIYADSPDFEEVVALGQEWRNADRPHDHDDEKAA
ncbi:hypothetical protein [Armatimonas sp.]|uniref:hypothetical protein n=1 Tax=Armatimonas sp. TaxID=1872638 RepID=UPI003751E2EB